VLGYKPNVPHFAQGFRGFGYNKYSWFVEAFYMGFSFAVLRDFFVVHLDHPVAYKQISLGSLKQMDRFKGYLRKKYRVHNKDLELIQWMDKTTLEMLKEEQALRQKLLNNTSGHKKIGFTPKYHSKTKLPQREPSKVMGLPSRKTKAARRKAEGDRSDKNHTRERKIEPGTAEQEERKRKRQKRFVNRAGIRAARADKQARKKEEATLNKLGLKE
jgi:hypothetical protein